MRAKFVRPWRTVFLTSCGCLCTIPPSKVQAVRPRCSDAQVGVARRLGLADEGELMFPGPPRSGPAWAGLARWLVTAARRGSRRRKWMGGEVGGVPHLQRGSVWQATANLRHCGGGHEPQTFETPPGRSQSVQVALEAPVLPCQASPDHSEDHRVAVRHEGHRERLAPIFFSYFRLRERP